MAPKSQSKKTETPAQVAPVVEAAPVAAAPQKVSKKSTKKEEVAAPVVEAAPAVEASEQGEKKERRTVTKETLHFDFEAL